MLAFNCNIYMVVCIIMQSEECVRRGSLWLHLISSPLIEHSRPESHGDSGTLPFSLKPWTQLEANPSLVLSSCAKFTFIFRKHSASTASISVMLVYAVQRPSTALSRSMTYILGHDQPSNKKTNLWKTKSRSKARADRTYQGPGSYHVPGPGTW